MESEGIIKGIVIHAVEDTNVGTKLYGNPSNSCQEISLKTKNLNLLVALEADKSSGLLLSSGDYEYLHIVSRQSI